MTSSRIEPRKRSSRQVTRVEVPLDTYLLERLSADFSGIVDVDALRFEEIGPFICAGAWTATVFKGRRHKKKDFLQHGGVLALDFDSGLSLEQAKLRFSGYRHIVGLTKSHQKTKNPGSPAEKAACDRFRVLLFADRLNASVEELEATNQALAVWNPEADRSCLHAAKVWSPCTEIVAQCPEGRLVQVESVAKPPVREPSKLVDSTREPPPSKGMQGDDQYQRGRQARTSQPAAPERIHRAAESFLKATRPSISGEGGHNKLFRAASTLVKEFMLHEEEALDLLWRVFNPRCDPRWTRSELRHKVRDALHGDAHVYGYGVNQTWDVRWRCCPPLSDLLDRLEANATVDWSVYAPTIEESALKALAARKIRALTSKKRPDPWVADLKQFLDGAPKDAFTAEYLLSTAFRIDAPTLGQRMRLGRAMGALGWKSKRTKGKQNYLSPATSSDAPRQPILSGSQPQGPLSVVM